VSKAHDPETGHVGGVMTCCDIKLEDVPEMDYFTSSIAPQGEICFRGPNVFKGYFKQPEKTREVLDSEGWLDSGVIGELRPNGSIKIIDRKKNIFKLSQGENVAPEKIEYIYNQIPIIAQTFIHGDSMESNVVGIIVPN
jgi:long-chain acyl-CoA synthetase